MRMKWGNDYQGQTDAWDLGTAWYILAIGVMMNVQ